MPAGKKAPRGNPAPRTVSHVALQPLACTLAQFRTILYPCSRATANLLVQTGELESFLANGRRMVLMEEARAFVARKAANGGAVKPEISAMKAAAGRKGVEAQRARRQSEAADIAEQREPEAA